MSRFRVASLIPILWNMVLFLLCLLVFKSVLVEAFYIPTKSMAPTLDVSDYVVVAKFPYGLQLPLQEGPVIQWATPSRGEIIVFTRKEEPETHFVKRVVGIEGDSIEIRGAELIVNGLLVREPYAVWKHDRSSRFYHYGPVTVPKGSIFVLGDNRAESRDSRAWIDPFVSLKHVVGKAFLIYWSTEHLSRIGETL